MRDEKDYFDEIPDLKISKEMLDLAKHIVETKSGHFHPERFEDHYESALKELLKRKAKGEEIETPKQREPARVINLMDALRKSVEVERAGKTQEQRTGARRTAAARSHGRAGQKTRKAG